MERAFAFMRALDAPVHAAIGKARARPRRGEVSIDESWSLRIADDAPAQALAAAEDLKEFLSVGFGVRLGDDRRGARVVRISAGKDRTDPPCARDEGYTLKVDADRIAIRGRGPRGALHGVFKLESILKARGAPCVKKRTVRQAPRFAPRILRSFSSPYYTEAIDGKSHYTDNYLCRLAHLGYDAIWLRGELRSLSRTRVFPDLGKHSARNLAALNDLIERAARWGIGVYLYLCEPLGIPTRDAFWRRHPDVRGARGGEMGKREQRLYAMCTSTKKVKRFLYESSRDLFTRAPGLEGAFLITASEHTAHCKQRKTLEGLCPRCADRPASDIVAEIVTLVRNGARDAGSAARVVAWNWAWDAHLDERGEEKVVRAMPKDVGWMANVENGGVVERLGVKLNIWEYSLCYPGPSPLYRKKARRARKHGHCLWAKAQINVTHELASMPYMPVPFLLRDKFAGLARAGVEGIMCCWIFGGYPGVGSKQASAMMWRPFGDARKALLDCAADIYGERAAPLVVKAWKLFSRGYRKYPFDRGLYSHVLNSSPAHPFYFRPVRRFERANWTQKIEPYGDILQWCVHLAPELTALCYEEILADWDKALAILKRALRSAPGPLRAEAQRDVNVCEAIGVHFRSGMNYIRFIRLRDRLPRLGGASKWPKRTPERLIPPVTRDAREIEGILREMKKIVADEAKLVADYLPVAESDSRLGYHSEGGYRYRPKHLRAKLEQLRRVLEAQIPAYEKRLRLSSRGAPSSHPPASAPGLTSCTRPGPS